MSGMKLSVRFSIITFSSTAVILFSGLVSVVSYLGSKNSIHFLVNNLMEKAVEHTIEKTTNYLDAAVLNSTLNDKLINNRLIRVNKNKFLKKYFRVMIETNTQFVSAFYGDENGNFLMVKEMPDRSISVQTITRRHNTAKVTWEHDKEDWKKDEKYSNKILPTEEALDPRKRPWYEKAKAAPISSHSWTEVYVFFNDRKPGITCSKKVYDPSGRFIGVIGIDISIAELSEFLSKLKVGTNGKVFILNENGQVVALPTTDPAELEKMIKEEGEGKNKKLTLMTADKLNDKEFSSSFIAYQDNKKFKQENKGEDHDYHYFSFSFQGVSYFSNYTQFIKDDIRWTIGIVVPEDDFMFIVKRNNKIILIMSLVLIVVAILFEMRFSKTISRPLTQLSEEMRKIQNFDLSSDVSIESFLIEVNNIAQSFTKMRTGLRSFKKYVPDELVRELIALNKEAVLEGERRELTIYFSDIASFTSISEKLQPEELVELLSEYLGSASKILIENGATLDKYIGDAIMAFWGAPNTLENHAVFACLAALRHKKALAVRNRDLEKRGKATFHDRIGIHTGEVIVGNMGSENRLNYTVIGDNVNLASRLEGINKYYGTEIVISETTYAQAKDFIETRMIDMVTVKGKKNAIGIYELISEKQELPPDIKKFIDIFNEGIVKYRNKQFTEALEHFKQTSSMSSKDYPSKLYVERCETYIQSPPDEDWNGVYELKSK